MDPIIKELPLDYTYHWFEFLPVLKVTWFMVSIETIIAVLIPPLFGVFCNMLLFEVSTSCIFEDICQLLD